MADTLGERIKRARTIARLSLEGLAERTGLSKTVLWELETGASDNPTLRTLVALSGALNTPVDQLIHGGKQAATINYTNHRGERSARLIYPVRLFYGANEWHKEPQWLLEAWCFERAALRTFAMKNIHQWEVYGD